MYRKLLILCIYLSIVALSCKHNTPIVNTGEVDQYGCTLPPPDVLKKTGIDIKLAASTFGKVATGDFGLKIDPQLIQLTSQAMTDEKVKSYLRCLSIQRDKYTTEQAAYLDVMANFMKTNPNTEQFIKWQSNNPFPGTRKESNGAVVNYPIEVSLRIVIEQIASLDGYAVRFKTCDEGVLTQKILKGPMKARGTLELIEKLPLYLVDKSVKVDFDIAKLEDKGVFEITCKNN